MKTTPFTDFHIKLGARMQPFAGFNMPVEYSGINDEHITVRTKAGLFDASHMGEFWVKGPDATQFLQYITTNDITKLTDGKVQYTCMPNGSGGIVDDMLVYRINKETYMLVVNASNIEKDWKWCKHHANKYGLVIGRDLYNASDEIALLALQGPQALKIISKITTHPVEEMGNYTFSKIDIAGIRNAIFSITGYTGAGGCEMYVANEDGPALWDAIFRAGREYGLKPAGLGARDTLRLEMGFCLYGQDIDGTTSPIEAGLGWITKFTDNNNFIDKEYLLAQKKNGTERKLVCFIMCERGIPRLHYEIADVSGNKIGEVTSGTMLPTHKLGAGMGYVKSDFAKEGTDLSILVRNKSLRAKVVKFPYTPSA